MIIKMKYLIENKISYPSLKPIASKESSGFQLNSVQNFFFVTRKGSEIICYKLLNYRYVHKNLVQL